MPARALAGTVQRQRVFRGACVAEVTAAFERYEAALVSNDWRIVAAHVSMLAAQP